MKPSCFGRGTMVQTIGTSVTAGNQGWGWWGYAHCISLPFENSRVNIQSPSDLQNGTRKLDLGTSAETSWVLYTDVYSICQSMSQTLGSLNCPNSPPTKSGGPRLLFGTPGDQGKRLSCECSTNDGTTGWQPWLTMKTITQRMSKSESLIFENQQCQNYTFLITEKPWKISNGTT